MNKIHKAVLLLKFPEEDLNRIVKELDADEVVICSIRDGAKIWEEMKDAEVAMISYPLTGLDQKNIGKLRWLHATEAGLDMIYTPKLAANPNLTVTSGNGRSSRALAEHAFMFMLNLAYQFPKIYDAQKEQKWIVKMPEGASTLVGKTLALFGVGNVGTEIAKLGKAFGMTVYGYVRGNEALREPYDQFFSGEKGLEEILGKADYTVLSMPLSDETYHTFNKKEFDLMKESSCLINMARGPIINEKELIAQLENHRIRGFAADSFEMEPLDAQSPLWRMDNVLITPHLTPSQPGKQEFMTNLIIDNIRAFKNGEPLKNTMKPFLAYSGPTRYNFDLASSLMKNYSEKEK